MQNPEQMIGVFNLIFIITLILGIAFLALSVLLFFKFDIKRLLDVESGREKQRSIQKMEEINAETGKLRYETNDYTGEYTFKTNGRSDKLAGVGSAQNLNEVKASQEKEISTKNTLLNNNATNTAPVIELDAVIQTTVLDNGSSETTLLNTTPEVVEKEHVEESASNKNVEKTIDLDGVEETKKLDLSQINQALSEEKQVDDIQSEGMNSNRPIPGTFKIERQLMWIHTEEVL